MRGNIADRIIPNVISRHVRAIENVARNPGLRLKNEVGEKERKKREQKKTFRLPSTRTSFLERYDRDTTANCTIAHDNDHGKQKYSLLPDNEEKNTRIQAIGRSIVRDPSNLQRASKLGNKVHAANIRRE